jgi:hypothetical protein
LKKLSFKFNFFIKILNCFDYLIKIKTNYPLLKFAIIIIPFYVHLASQFPSFLPSHLQHLLVGHVKGVANVPHNPAASQSSRLPFNPPPNFHPWLPLDIFGSFSFIFSFPPYNPSIRLSPQLFPYPIHPER